MSSQDNNQLNISKIFNTKGKDIILWKCLLYDISIKDLNRHENIISKLNQCLIEDNYIDLTLSIIDFIIDYGNSSIIELVAQRFFLENIKRLLSNKSRADTQTRKMVLFLIQKWAKKFGEESYTQINELYNEINSLRRYNFPSSGWENKTYIKFISQKEISEAKEIIIKQKQSNNPFMENNIKTVYLDAPNKMSVVEGYASNYVNLNAPLPVYPGNDVVYNSKNNINDNQNNLEEIDNNLNINEYLNENGMNQNNNKIYGNAYNIDNNKTFESVMNSQNNNDVQPKYNQLRNIDNNKSINSNCMSISNKNNEQMNNQFLENKDNNRTDTSIQRSLQKNKSEIGNNNIQYKENDDEKFDYLDSILNNERNFIVPKITENADKKNNKEKNNLLLKSHKNSEKNQESNNNIKEKAYNTPSHEKNKPIFVKPTPNQNINYINNDNNIEKNQNNNIKESSKDNYNEINDNGNNPVNTNIIVDNFIKNQKGKIKSSKNNINEQKNNNLNNINNINYNKINQNKISHNNDNQNNINNHNINNSYKNNQNYQNSQNNQNNQKNNMQKIYFTNDNNEHRININNNESNFKQPNISAIRQMNNNINIQSNIKKNINNHFINDHNNNINNNQMNKKVRGNSCDRSNNNNKYQTKNVCYNNNQRPFINNKENNFETYDINRYKNEKKKKIKKYNNWINMGKFSYYNSYKHQLLEGINEIRAESQKCKDLIDKYTQENYNYEIVTLKKLQKDIEKTCFRYNSLMNDEFIPRFYSEFDTNFKSASFNPTIKNNDDFKNEGEVYFYSGIITGSTSQKNLEKILNKK